MDETQLWATRPTSKHLKPACKIKTTRHIFQLPLQRLSGVGADIEGGISLHKPQNPEQSETTILTTIGPISHMRFQSFQSQGYLIDISFFHDKTGIGPLSSSTRSKQLLAKPGYASKRAVWLFPISKHCTSEYGI